MIKKRKCLFLETIFSNLTEKYDLFLNKKCSKFEHNPLNIEDFMAQNLKYLPIGRQKITLY